MRLSTTTRVDSPFSKPSDTDDLITWLQSNATLRPKDQAPLWSPTAFDNNSRKEKDAIEVSALVFDFDKGRDLIPLVSVGVCHAWHTTASHTENSPKWRLVIPLERPIAPKDWKKFWTNAAKTLNLLNHDPTCHNVGRFYYVPPVMAQWEVHQGKPFPVEELLNVRPEGDDLVEIRSLLLKARNEKYGESIRKCLSGEAGFENGNRDNGVTGLGFYLGRSVIPETVGTDSVYRTLERGLVLPGSESKEHWEKKFKAAFERGREARLEVQEESKEKQGLNAEWTKELQQSSRMDGSVMVISNCYNAAVILKNEGTHKFRKNLLEDTHEFRTDSDFRAMADADCTKVANWLQQKYRINLSRQQVYDQIDAIAPEYDPLKEYIARCRWDGQKRIDTFLVDLLGVEDTPQAKMYSRKWLIGLVARALKPGCKLDTVLTLRGAQGIGKSTGLRLLTEPWFSDSKINIGDKDSMQVASRFWVHEFGELASIKRADLETLKAFTTSTVDSFRPPYGRAIVQKPRRCVYVATTNEDEFLTDSTGARRFWVVKVVKRISFDAIRAAREQLIAEATEAFRNGEVWWLETEEERQLQTDSVEENQIDENEGQKDEIRRWWQARPFSARPKQLSTADVLRDIWNVPAERMGRGAEMMAGRALRQLGFIKTRVREGNDRRWTYRPSIEWERMPQKTGGQVKDFKVEDGEKHGRGGN